MPSADTAKRYGHVAARLIAMIGGILLGTSAAASYFIAGYADDALEAGTGAAENALRDGSTGLDEDTAGEAADWLHRLSDWLVDGRPDQFRNYCLVAIAAALIAMVAALPRRPDSAWPEIVWGLAALGGLAPNLAFDLWFSIWIFTGSLIVGAAALHYMARRDDHVRQAADVTRRAGAAAAPHVGSALSRGTKAAGDAYRGLRGGNDVGANPRTAQPAPAAPTIPQPAPAVAGSAATPAATSEPASPAARVATEPAPAPAASAPPRPTPGWYADPRREARLRYWDGDAWTDHTG